MPQFDFILNHLLYFIGASNYVWLNICSVCDFSSIQKLEEKFNANQIQKLQKQVTLKVVHCFRASLSSSEKFLSPTSCINEDYGCSFTKIKHNNLIHLSRRKQKQKSENCVKPYALRPGLCQIFIKKEQYQRVRRIRYLLSFHFTDLSGILIWCCYVKSSSINIARIQSAPATSSKNEIRKCISSTVNAEFFICANPLS